LAGLGEGHDPSLVVVELAPRLHARDHALQAGVEVGHRQRAAAAAGRADRRLVADVRQVGSGEAAGLLGHQAEVHGGVHRLGARVHAQDALAPLHVGWRDEDLAVEPARAQERRVELVQQV